MPEQKARAFVRGVRMFDPWWFVISFLVRRTIVFARKTVAGPELINPQHIAGQCARSKWLSMKASIEFHSKCSWNEFVVMTCTVEIARDFICSVALSSVYHSTAGRPQQRYFTLTELTCVSCAASGVCQGCGFWTQTLWHVCGRPAIIQRPPSTQRRNIQ